MRHFVRALAQTFNHTHTHRKIAVLFVIAWLLNQWIRTTCPQVAESALQAALRLLVVELLKLGAAGLLVSWRRHYIKTKEYHEVEEDRLLNTINNGHPAEHYLDLTGYGNGYISYNMPQWSDKYLPVVHTFLASALYAYYNYNASVGRHLTAPSTLYLIASFSTLTSLFTLHTVFSRIHSTSEWHAVLLQCCGLFIANSIGFTTSIPPSSFPIWIALAVCGSLVNILMSHIYNTLNTITLEFIHISLFASGSFIHALVALKQLSTFSVVSSPTIPQVISCFFQACVDLLALAIIYYSDAVTEGVLVSLGASQILLVSVLVYKLPSMSLVLGCIVVLIASLSYLVHTREDDWHAKKDFHLLRCLAGILSLSGIFVYLTFTNAAPYQNASLRAFDKPISLRETMSPAPPTCHRKPTMGSSNNTYHAFTDVLLIVFFSHARYDANLDYYKKVYSEFFPNMIFIGPGSREDAGFEHSYDVLVDSYQSDEDLYGDPTFYKMSGRMAHHMLYTALREYDCYDGYLWAPFDTLLNVPRLQQFDQQFFWYHSPFGEFVPNPALGPAAANASYHPLPATISPDPSMDLATTWKGWQSDWWWGDPHVGVEVCMRAFNKVPLRMRERMATFTNGTTRLIGGSADTVYIPGRHRKMFMEVLALFLDTSCFLEIATPTVVHLVVPPGEPILFVDHWWIWDPPFNATFVRQKWEEGFEVDTFHTFHWGDRDDNGVWKGNPEHIEDVRELLRESAERQGLVKSIGSVS